MDFSNQQLIHKKTERIEYIQFKKLLEYEDILTHAYTLHACQIDYRRQPDRSTDTEVIQNYETLCKELTLHSQHIVRPYQTHTNFVKWVDHPIEEITMGVEPYLETDGLLTKQRDAVLALTYADCIGLLFFDPNQRIIANIHSGWRGTLNRIGEVAVKEMIEKGHSRPKDIICCICPSIRSCHFEVEQEVADLFFKQFEYTGQINELIKTGKKVEGVQKYTIDTVKINQILLQQLGLKEENIVDSRICTVCHSNQFHSYRKDREQSGRNTAVIALR